MRPRNKYERQIWDKLFNKGWLVYHNGIPDIIAEHGKSLIAIEVKATKQYELSPEQIEVMAMLNRHGVKCLKWSPDGGFETIFPQASK